MRPFAFVFVLALFAAAALPVNAADSVDALLARSRAAMGGDALERVHGLYLTGAVDAVGVKGTIRQWFDLSAGTYAESQALGPLSGADGFDGRDAWVQDSSGIVHVDAGEQGRFLAIDQAYVASNRLWQPGHGGATLSLAGQQQDAGKQYDVLRVAPPDSAPFDLWFDAQTALPQAHRPHVALLKLAREHDTDLIVSRRTSTATATRPSRACGKSSQIRPAWQSTSSSRRAARTTFRSPAVRPKRRCRSNCSTITSIST